MKIRAFGEILLDMEKILDEMVDTHDVQMGDILNLVRGHLETHRPDCIEEYDDGGHPVFYYVPGQEEEDDDDEENVLDFKKH